MILQGGGLSAGGTAGRLCGPRGWRHAHYYAPNTGCGTTHGSQVHAPGAESRGAGISCSGGLACVLLSRDVGAFPAPPAPPPAGRETHLSSVVEQSRGRFQPEELLSAPPRAPFEKSPWQSQAGGAGGWGLLSSPGEATSPHLLLLTSSSEATACTPLTTRPPPAVMDIITSVHTQK